MSTDTSCFQCVNEQWTHFSSNTRAPGGSTVFYVRDSQRESSPQSAGSQRPKGASEVCFRSNRQEKETRCDELSTHICKNTSSHLPRPNGVRSTPLHDGTLGGRRWENVNLCRFHARRRANSQLYCSTQAASKWKKCDWAIVAASEELDGESRRGEMSATQKKARQGDEALVVAGKECWADSRNDDGRARLPLLAGWSAVWPGAPEEGERGEEGEDRREGSIGGRSWERDRAIYLFPIEANAGSSSRDCGTRITGVTQRRNLAVNCRGPPLAYVKYEQANRHRRQHTRAPFCVPARGSMINIKLELIDIIIFTTTHL